MIDDTEYTPPDFSDARLVNAPPARVVSCEADFASRSGTLGSIFEVGKAL